MRAWLREHSALFVRISPPAQHVRRCACGHIKATPIYAFGAKDTTVVDHERHLVGSVWIEGTQLDKFCDGTES